MSIITSNTMGHLKHKAAMVLWLPIPHPGITLPTALAAGQKVCFSEGVNTLTFKTASEFYQIFFKIPRRKIIQMSQRSKGSSGHGQHFTTFEWSPPMSIGIMPAEKPRLLSKALVSRLKLQFMTIFCQRNISFYYPLKCVYFPYCL